MPKTENQEKLFKEIEKYQKRVVTCVSNKKIVYLIKQGETTKNNRKK